jgi:hypothetical protein
MIQSHVETMRFVRTFFLDKLLPFLVLLIAVSGPVYPFIAVYMAFGGEWFRTFLSFIDNNSIVRGFNYLIGGLHLVWLIQLMFYLLFVFLLYIMPCIAVLCSILIITRKGYYKIIGGIALLINICMLSLIMIGE